MALAELLAELESLSAGGAAAFGSAADREALEAARVEFLGAKSGRLKAAQKALGSVAPADKPAAGKRFNEVKQALEAALAAAQERLENAPADSGSPPLDPTLPGVRPRLGHLHPITQTIEELKEIMGRLGFTVADGPEIEDEWHNFEAARTSRRLIRQGIRWRISSWRWRGSRLEPRQGRKAKRQAALTPVRQAHGRLALSQREREQAAGRYCCEVKRARCKFA